MTGNSLTTTQTVVDLTRQALGEAPYDPEHDDLPDIEVGGGPATIRTLQGKLNEGVLNAADVYVTHGNPVTVERISGAATAAAGDEDSPLPVTPTVVTAPVLANLLARHTRTFRVKTRKDAAGNQEFYEEECTPPRDVLTAALAPSEWPGLMPLRGIIGCPVLRPDGTLLQDSGYDVATGLFLSKKVPLQRIPDQPTEEQVTAARKFLLDEFLTDFPWVSDADRANYIGLLVSPILRDYLRTLTPFAVIDATMPASGKTILTSCIGLLVGQRVLSWPESDEELRKAVTSVITEQVGAVIFDNIGEGSVIDSPILARLITERTWGDRLLGTNKTVSIPNDRLWACTGNSVRLGGDLASRSVLVRLDPKTPRPEERTGFAIPGLDSWVLDPANQRTILQHLLVLVLDWTRAGAPRNRGPVMRQFTDWANAIGGFLTHHGIHDFLANNAEVREIDDGNTEWAAFLAKWYLKFGDAHITSAALRKDAEPMDLGHGVKDDDWEGAFLVDDNGRLPTARSLGRKLRGHVGRWHDVFVLRSVTDSHDKMARWWVEKAGQEEASS